MNAHPIGFTLAILSFFGLGAARAEPRTFTSPDGRTVQAEVLAATPDQVTLKLATGQTLVSLISRFSKTDQQFIQEWRKQNPAPIKYGFAASYTKEKTDSAQTVNRNVTSKTDTWICKMKVTNRTGQTLEGIDVSYDVFYTEMERGQPVLRKQSGKAKIDSIKHLEEQVIPTAEVKLTTSTLDGAFYYSDGTRSRQRDSLEGMAFALSHEGKEVFRWASAGVPKDRIPTGKGTSASSGSLFDK